MLGKQIKKARKEEGLTQADLAEKVNTTKSVISEIENGKRNIGFEMVERIAAALNRIISDQLFIKP